MQNVLLAGVAVLVLVMAGVGIRTRSGRLLLRSTDAGGVAALNRAQLSRVFDKPEHTLPATPQPPSEEWAPVTTQQDRLALQRQLRTLMTGGPEDRLQAMRLAGHWGHASVLPLLRRGLRDSDSRVVLAAAEAIAPLRGGPRSLNPQKVSRRAPRNVARTR